MRECILRGGSDRPIVLGSGQLVAPSWCVSGGTGQRGSVGSETEPESGGDIRPCVGRVEAGRGAWGSAGRQAQVGENLDDHCGLFDRREERQGAAALRTGGDVDGEDAFESLGPAHPGPIEMTLFGNGVNSLAS